MKLITPPKASAPYTADAESVRISILSTAESGIELMSTADDPVNGLPGTRRPLIKTAVLPGPSPRRSTSAICPKDVPERSRKEPKEL